MTPSWALAYLIRLQRPDHLCMGKRRVSQASNSEDDAAPMRNDGGERKKGKKLGVEDNVEEEPVLEDAKPLGPVLKVSGKGKQKKRHYRSFNYEGNTIELEDPVLLTPEDRKQKPYVAIIKDITQEVNGKMMVTVQWFYRSEETKRKGKGGHWETRDARELFYSFHLDEVPAESVMHKCIVHFVPLNMKVPLRSELPGFIVQKVYDTVERRLWSLTDRDYEDNKQHEIDVLIQKTLERLGRLPEIGPDGAYAGNEDQPMGKKKDVTPTYGNSSTLLFNARERDLGDLMPEREIWGRN